MSFKVQICIIHALHARKRSNTSRLVPVRVQIGIRKTCACASVHMEGVLEGHLTYCANHDLGLDVRLADWPRFGFSLAMLLALPPKMRTRKQAYTRMCARA